LLEQDSVEHTARRAGPSVADAGDDRVDAALGLLDDLVVGGDARVLLPPEMRLRDAVLLLQDLADLDQELVGVELRVLDEPDALARERAGSSHVGQRLRTGLDGRAQDLHRGLFYAPRSWRATVPAGEDARLPKPGMKHEKGPARPPAATTRKSSGVITSERCVFSSSGLTGPAIRPMRLKCATVDAVFS